MKLAEATKTLSALTCASILSALVGAGCESSQCAIAGPQIRGAVYEGETTGLIEEESSLTERAPIHRAVVIFRTVEESDHAEETLTLEDGEFAVNLPAACDPVSWTAEVAAPGYEPFAFELEDSHWYSGELNVELRREPIE